MGAGDSGGSRWNEFTKFFSEASHKVSVVAGNIHYQTGKKLWSRTCGKKEAIEENAVLYRTWTYPGYNTNFFGRLLGYLSYMISSCCKALFIRKADLIIVTSPPLFVGLSAIVASKLKRIPFIFEVRDLWPESAIATGVITNGTLLRIMYKIEYALYKNAKKIVVLTPAFKENISTRFPQFADKIEQITNGADFDIMKEYEGKKVREKYGWENKIVFSYFGAHGVANDLMQVVEAARRMKENDKLVFALIGDGMQKPMLKEKAEEHGLTNIVFIDSIPKQQVADYIDASDVCMAILKKTDTFKTVYPNKVFDYMSCRKPILVTIDGITRELIEQSQSGLYAEPENTDDFCKAIQKLADTSQEEMAVMGDKGYDYVSTHFDRKKLAEKYLEVIKSV